MTENQPLKPGDIYCGKESQTGKYFAYQLITINEDDITYYLLDYFDEKLPDEKDAELMKPFKRHRWFFREDSDDYCHSCSGKLPLGAVYVCNRKCMISGECRTYGSWPSGKDNVAEEQWAEIPEKQRTGFKAALHDETKVMVAGEEYRKSLQYIGDNLLTKIKDYSEFEKLPAAYSFTATQYYPQLIPFFETRWTASKIDWEGHGQTEMDLSRTHLREIIIEAGNLTELRLPASCERLTLTGKLSPGLKVFSPNAGAELMLVITLHEDHIPDTGLTALKKLNLTEANKLDLTVIPAYYPALRELRIWGKPGYLLNVPSLAGLKELRWLSISELFGFTGEDFPAPGVWPHLHTLWMDSIPEQAGKYIKKAYKGKIYDIGIRKLRKPEWLAENLDNPLRHWDGSEFVPASKFKKAVVIYRETRREALAAGENFLNDKNTGNLQERLEQISKNYVIAFNKLEGKSWYIETEEREDICMAFEAILDAVDVMAGDDGFTADRSRIYDIMDKHREW